MNGPRIFVATSGPWKNTSESLPIFICAYFFIHVSEYTSCINHPPFLYTDFMIYLCLWNQERTKFPMGLNDKSVLLSCFLFVVNIFKFCNSTECVNFKKILKISLIVYVLFGIVYSKNI